MVQSLKQAGDTGNTQQAGEHSGDVYSAQLQMILLQTPAEVLVAKGEQLELSCSAKVSLGRLFWYRLDENASSHFVISATIMDQIERGHGIDERFTLIKNTFRSTFSLIIKDPQLTDNGTYHCMMFSSQTTYLGGGSVVTVVPEKPIVTSPPTTTKPRKIIRYKNPPLRGKKKRDTGYVCDWPIWGSLTACNLLLLTSILSIFIHRRNKYYQRRCPQQFRKR
ncbi:T-cell surface glycoprotein CD8 beta chain-like [Pristis pectinata]|uniref:T-cell surface glycoprotein CD8 beta chain-like n=1 Tax=Pristis pectinata TaxID=685728 RepID=UPI00223D8265|nr:T-cell surface glycoprotein CD8 beta chain-like [Pristis pectinata]